MPNLQRANPKNAHHWYALLEKSRANLEQWMPHLKEIQSLADAQAYVEKYARLDIYLGEHIYEIWEGDNLVGLISLHSGRMRKQTAELGYWLGTDYTGRGLGSAACQLLLSKTFIERPLNQIFIRCEEENYASQAVARRLGFSFLEKKGSILSFGMTREEWLFNYYEEEDLLCFWEEEELFPPILLD